MSDYAEQEADRLSAVKGQQWRTQIAAVERKLVEVRFHLRQNPQDSAARAEAEKLEAMFRQLRDEGTRR